MERAMVDANNQRSSERLATYRDLQARLDADPGVKGERRGKERREALYEALLAEKSDKR
jgi:hypothetical protein